MTTPAEIHILKAQGLGDIEPQSVIIRIDEEIGEAVGHPLPHNVLQLSEELFWDQAHTLAEVLYNSLPQGTRHRLIIELMRFEVVLFYGIEQVPLDAKLLNWLDSLEDPILFRSHGQWQLDASDSILDSDKFSGATVREALTDGYITLQKKAKPLADDPNLKVVEVVGPDGEVHYTRPFNHPDVLEAIQTPGYSIRGVTNGNHT